MTNRIIFKMKITKTFEVWNKPDHGPLMVQERDETGTFFCWNDMDAAIQRAQQLKQIYPHMDFVVRCEAYNTSSFVKVVSIVYDTSEK